MSSKNIRDLVGSSTQGLSVDGWTVTKVTKAAQGYCVKLGNGELISAKGHQKLEDLGCFKPTGSHARIRRYGKFGSTIN